MERKIGDIFEYNGEWYQCVTGRYCDDCAFRNDNCEERERITLKEQLTKEEITGLCVSKLRSDCKSVIFKKLEKVGEPIIYMSRTFQKLKSSDTEQCKYCYFGNQVCNPQLCGKESFLVEIKQTEEDMEENKTTLPKEDNALTRTVYAYVNGKISDKELIRSIKEMSDEYPYDKNGLKPFSLEAAKTGKPVCTRDGRKARIICFDAEGEHPIIALVTDGVQEFPYNYTKEGYYYTEDAETMADLMMLSEKKEGWVNVYKDGLLGTRAYNTKKEAFDNASPSDYVDTAKISWYE